MLLWYPAPSRPASPVEPIDGLVIIAPSAAGGGYDLTAQAMRRVLESNGIARNVIIRRSPGAGGLLGLSELLSAHAGDGRVLLVGGLVTLGATTTYRTVISLLDATPVSRLTGEYDVVAVSANSPYRTLDELLDAMSAAPNSVRWVGGSAGGADELLVQRLASAARVDPHAMHYTPLPGGPEIAEQLVSGRFAAAVSGLAEFEPLIQAGQLRALAVSAPRALAGVQIPTFEELGVTGLATVNWRGVFAAPRVSEKDRYRLQAAIGRMVQQPDWQVELARHRWEDAYLPAEEFASFLISRKDAVESALRGPAPTDPRILPATMVRRFRWTLALMLVAAALIFVLCVQRTQGRQREGELRTALNEVSQKAALTALQVQGMLAGVSSQIETEFDRWKLSSAERAVAHLMLKGFRLSDIAVMRKTSSRTVRQQAHAIYRKAGLEGRSDLAAYFLEEFLAPVEFSAAHCEAGLPAFAADAATLIAESPKRDL